jgi:hypothetical protein
MRERTCAACDCKLEGATVNVTLGGKTVEVCCEECAVALREADAASSAKKELSDARA